MPPRAAAQNARKSVRPKNHISYKGMTSAGATAPPTSLSTTTRKSVVLKPKQKQKREIIKEIRIQEGETLSKGAVSTLKLNHFFHHL